MKQKLEDPESRGFDVAKGGDLLVDGPSRTGGGAEGRPRVAELETEFVRQTWTVMSGWLSV